MMRLHPVGAFLITALVMTLVLGGGMAWLSAGNAGHVSRHSGETQMVDVSTLFSVALLAVVGAGLLVGLPVLAVLHWMGLSRRLWALMLAGLAGGILIIVILAAWPPGSLGWDLVTPALIAGGFGAASGLLWWLLTGGAARPVAAGSA